MEPANVEQRYFQITVYTASSRQSIPRIIIISHGYIPKCPIISFTFSASGSPCNLNEPVDSFFVLYN